MIARQDQSNDHDTHQYPQSRRHAERAAVLPSSTSSSTPATASGLVAANGRGKSTLLRCIAGALEPTEGDITAPRGLTIGHVEQDVPTGAA